VPQFLPLFVKNIFLQFVPEDKVDQDSKVLKDYFEGGDPQKSRQLLEEQNRAWKEYLDKLAEPRHLQLFNTAKIVPDEKTKIEQLMQGGNKLAKELHQINNARSISTRTWPLEPIEAKKKEYAEAKSIRYPDANTLEQHLSWIISNAMTEIHFPHDFFTSMIFKLEPEYATYPYEFPENFLGSQQLYIWYLIYTKKGPAQFFNNLEDMIIQRYRVTRIISMSAYGFLNLFICNGNDQNSCNRFFTRRMKSNIDEELNGWCALVNNIEGEYEEASFEQFFMTNPFSNCNIRDPFQKSFYSEPGVIEQAIYNHLIGNYSAATNLLFPIIEGICWDISVAEHLANGGVYTTNSDLTTRDLHNRQLVDASGNTIQVHHGTPSLRELLEQTKMKDVFHVQFMKLLCSELFPEERNPILHGMRLDYNLPFQSARLLLVLEYLHAVVKSKGYRYPVQLDPEGYWTPEKSGDHRV